MPLQLLMTRPRVVRRTFLALQTLTGAAVTIAYAVLGYTLALELGPLHGTITEATIAVTLALMLGAAAAHRIGARTTSARLPQVIAFASLLPGIWVVLAPVIHDWARGMLPAAYGEDGASPWVTLARLAFSLVLLGPPTVAVGACWPLSVRWLTARRTVRGDGGRLATAWLGGVALGAALVLVAVATGLTTGAMRFGAFMGMLAAAAGLLAIGRAPRSPRATEQEPRGVEDDRGTPGAPWVAGLLAGSTGLALALQVTPWEAWVSAVLGPGVATAGTFVGLLVGGAALGAAAAAYRLRRSATQALDFALFQVVIGAAAIGAIALTTPVAGWTATRLAANSIWPPWPATLLVLPLAAAIGAALPFALSLGGQRASRAAAVVGPLIALGGTLGLSLASYVLVPLLGWHGTAMTGAVLLTALGGLTALLVEGSPSPRMAGVSLAAVAVVASSTAPALSPDMVASLAHLRAVSLPPAPDPGESRPLRPGTLVYYAEGAAGTVAVRRLAGVTSLVRDGWVTETNGSDMVSQKLLAHVPLMLHQQASEIGLIGIGTGTTLGAILRHTIDRVDVIEPSPEALEAASFFNVENHGALNDVRSNLLVHDGRAHLMHTSRRYDVILSSSARPWQPSGLALVTRQFYDIVRARLKPGGVFAQRIRARELDEEAFGSIVNTFVLAFPTVRAWHAAVGEVILIGSNVPIDGERDRLAAALTQTGIRSDLAEIAHDNMFAIWSLRANPATLAPRESASVWYDAAPRALAAPRPRGAASDPGLAAHLRRSRGAARRAAVSTGVAPPAEDWRVRGWATLAAGAVRDAFDDFASALELDPTDGSAVMGAAEAAGQLGREADGLRLLDMAAERAPSVAAPAIAATRLLLAEGRIREAFEAAETATTIGPTDPRAWVQRALVLLELGDPTGLAACVAQLAALDGDPHDVLYLEGHLALLTGDATAALERGRRYQQLDPADPRAYELLGLAQRALGDVAPARTAFLTAIRAAPRRAASYLALADLELAAGNRQTAAGLYFEALLLEPRAQRAASGLARAAAPPAAS